MNEHLRLMAPAWPLQHSIAVNPFWNQIDEPFDDVMTKMSYLVHAPLYMPLSYYLDKYQNGEIADGDFEVEAIRLEKEDSFAPFNLKNFIQQSSDATFAIRECQGFTDFIDQRRGTTWRSFVTHEIAKYASAYFDQGQALAKFPWRELSFYRAWFAAQEFDRSFQRFGADRFLEVVAEFKNLDPKDAIQKILSRFGLLKSDEIALYIGRLSVANMGWASQFSYHEWQGQLGNVANRVQSVELVAIQMITDYAIAEIFEASESGLMNSWVKSFQAKASEQKSNLRPFELNRIWQSALERSRQRQVGDQIKPSEMASTLPKVQIAMCLDVRSETYRRAIESVSNEIETIGFAGFFGLAFEYRKIDEKFAGARLPALLKAGFSVREEMTAEVAAQRRAMTLSRSYFRNLRKAPMSSFLFVELSSFLSLRKLVSDFLDSIKTSKKRTRPKKFTHFENRPGQKSLVIEGHLATLESKVETAATILKHMGLKFRMGRLVVFAGHGSANANNAFASASDCGACGGHPGDVNARLLAGLLNDRDVRIGLKARTIEIPDSTHFISALHETVTDEFYLLDDENIPDSHKEELAFLKAAIEKAGIQARKERQFARSSCLDPSSSRRSKNWSEVRPEWALAGNSCFVVAPRRFTRAANFNGKSFLHDYDWRNDSNFETLELIMTAPMLVTNWINFQYYASTVAPKIYGSGNKLLHNLVNENGVLEGNGGDLRIGLPWQSVNDGQKFVHEPVRLAVFIAAPIEEIEKIITKHPAVRNLVVNEWLYLFHVDDETGQSRRRERNGKYI